MPASFKVIPEQRLYVVQFHGLVRDEEVLSCYREIFAHPEMRPGFSELSLSDYEYVPEVTTEGLRRLSTENADYLRRHDKTQRTIHVVGGLKHELIVDHYSALASLSPGALEQVEIVPHVSDALERLDIDSTALPIPNLDRFKFAHQLIGDARHLKEVKVLSDDKTITPTDDALFNDFLSTLIGDDLVTRVRMAIAHALPSGKPRDERIASDLFMSPRTLRRKLAAEGTSFSMLVDGVRYELARRYIDDPCRSLTEISFLLGFSELSVFSKSFKRWTGKTPSAFRET
jgi:AraC-like DNA-binding protein